ncbi:rRNA biogenesis protein rrp5 [Thecaphora frezii]
MPGIKRSRDEPKQASSSKAAFSASSASKKLKKSSDFRPKPKPAPAPVATPQEVDFPRGGGTGLTPLEFREAKREARAELNDDTLFTDAATKKQKQKQKSKPANDSAKKPSKDAKAKGSKHEPKKPKLDHIRVEHLNYKRLLPGARVLCSVLAVHPLAVVVSLPNQLLGHIPATQISQKFTERLQRAAENDDEEQDEDGDSDEEMPDEAVGPSKRSKAIPELRDLFHVGQWLRASVVNVHSTGVTKGMGSGREGGEYERESRRVELSIAPHLVNEGVSVTDLSVGSTLSASVTSLEDHGYLLDTGIEELSGFLNFKNAAKLPVQFGAGADGKRLQIGSVIEVKVAKIAENKRTFDCTADPEIRDSIVKSGPSVTAIVPGTLVQALITASLATGLNIKLFGMFDATIDRFHLGPLPEGKSIQDVYKEGSKHKARVIWDLPVPDLDALDGTLSDSERKFGLSLAPHIVQLAPPATEDGQVLSQAYPIGTTLDIVVTATDSDWGLTCSIQNSTVGGFVHISQTSDDHVVSLPANSGPFKVGSRHKARVIGHAPADKLLQLSLKQSVLQKKFMRVSEVAVGEVFSQAVIKKVSSEAIILQLNGNVDGAVFPNHFADIALKNPEKKFKPGLTVKARVLRVDPNRNRITLTLKKSLVSSELPVVAAHEDARPGVVTHAVVSKVLDSSLLVDFYGALRAIVPASELADHYVSDLKASFSEGKVVKVRITAVDEATGRITASVRQASAAYLDKINVDAVEVGDKVVAQVAAVHQEVVVLTLVDSGIRALITLLILAGKRGTTVDALRASLAEGDRIEDLTVVEKNHEKGLVICGDKLKAKRDKAKANGGPSTASAGYTVGQIAVGRVARKNAQQQDCMVELSEGGKAILHLTDCADDFSDPEKAALPEEDEQIRCLIIGEKKAGRLAQASTRLSRIAAAEGSPVAASSIVDPEIDSAKDLKKGRKYRGFVKSVADSGLFVSLGRNVVARVQIRELFDNYVKDWKPRFVAGQVVEGTVMDVDEANNKVEMSLKSEPGSSKSSLKDREAALKAKDPSERKLTDYRKGDKVKGFVRGISEFGVFVQIEGTSVSGLCHRSELSDSKEVDAIKAFHVGDRVRAIVLDVNGEKRRISFGLKPSYFEAKDFEDSGDEDDEEDEEDEDDQDHDVSALLDGVDDSDEEEDDDEAGSDSDSDGDFIEMDEDDDEGEEASRRSKPKSSGLSSKAPVPALTLSGGFSWSAPADDSDDEAGSASSASEDEGSDDEASAAAASKRNKRKRGKGKAIEEDLTADLAAMAPQSNTDFERLLLGSPNSSYLWIQFMSFQLQLSDVDKAREVARRAIKVISFREEQERLNVWIALLNLENTYGSEETLEATFKEAAQVNDALTIHLRMAAIFEQTSKLEQADETFKKASKKFGYVPDVWIAWNQFMLRHEREDDARLLLPRSLQSLEKRDHVKTITAFALNEFKYGQAERGRTIFEGLVDSYAKRLDLWWQYIDQEAKVKNVSGVRNLFERVLALKLSSKKAKSVLKKWLEFEKTHGTPEGQQEVLARARKFVEEMQKKQSAGDDEAADEDCDDQ